MIIRICSLLVLLVGCSAQVHEPQIRNTIAQIPVMEQVTSERLERAAKPELQIVVQNGTRVPQLDANGMRQLIDLYKSDGHAVQVANSALDTASRAVEERNRLLALAQAEEELGNALRKQLATEQNDREREKLAASIELNATRVIAVLAMILAL